MWTGYRYDDVADRDALRTSEAGNVGGPDVRPRADLFDDRHAKVRGIFDGRNSGKRARRHRRDPLEKRRPKRRKIRQAEAERKDHNNRVDVPLMRAID